jgi:predicted molibdopterin-dependent oxidoreductase YjgC
MLIEMNNLKFASSAEETVLDVAKRNGIEIPTLCHSEEFGCKSQCMVCAVWLIGQDVMIPACSTKVQSGMQILTDSNDVSEFRRKMLEVLLSEHLGDCKAPCQLVCPDFADIPDLFGKLERGEDVEMPNCKDCSAPCEKACRRGRIDSSIKIKEIFTSITDQIVGKPSLKEKQYNHKLGLVTDEIKQVLLDDLAQKNSNKSFKIEEISRCLFCGCSADSACDLQKIATIFDSKQNEYKSIAAVLKPRVYTDTLVFDPNKCVRCMQCTNIKASDGRCLCISGKGEDILPSPPIGVSWDETVAGIENELVDSCPTGAMKKM